MRTFILNGEHMKRGHIQRTVKAHTETEAKRKLRQRVPGIKRVTVDYEQHV